MLTSVEAPNLHQSDVSDLQANLENFKFNDSLSARGRVEVAPRASHCTSQQSSDTMYNWPHLSSFDSWTNLMGPRIKPLQALLTSYEK